MKGRPYKHQLPYLKLAKAIDELLERHLIEVMHQEAAPWPEGVTDVLCDLNEALELADDAHDAASELLKVENALTTVRDALSFMHETGTKELRLIVQLQSDFLRAKSNLQSDESKGSPNR